METIIYNYLQNVFVDGEENLLATYIGKPAVFNTKVPDDINEEYEEEESLWKDDVQFPRCVFELNMQADHERKISGQLFVDVMCENEEESIRPETLADIAKQAVDGCFFSNTDLTISAQWQRSDIFTQNDDKVAGMTVVFDILAYPKQGTDSPDPIRATNLWLKTIYQNAYVIGFDKLPDVWKPTDETPTPTLYTRLSKIGQSNRMRSTAAVTWLSADIQIHVMNPSEDIRARISSGMIELLYFADKLILDDNSPMLIDGVNASFSADPQREGQINLKTTYGVLPVEKAGEPLKHIYTQGFNAESEVNNGKDYYNHTGS